MGSLRSGNKLGADGSPFKARKGLEILFCFVFKSNLLKTSQYCNNTVFETPVTL